MIRKTLVLLTILVGILFYAAPSVLGFSLLNLGQALNVSTGMSAKLACSAKYITGLEEQQIVEDLASYSPAARLVKLTYSNASKQVTASLFGMAQVSAKYRDNIGCSLELGDTSSLDDVAIEPILLSNQAWPLGNKVLNLNAQAQVRLEHILHQDNQQGLNTRALLMVKNGEIIAESYSENITHNTPLLGWSMGKSLTAIMLGRMEHLNMLAMTKTNLFSQWQEDKRNKLTLTHLLQMSSGLAFDETYAPGSDATHMLFTAHSASDVALVSELVKTPASHFSYSSGTTNLLSRIIHHQLGNSPQTDVNFLYQELFQPLGMSHSVFEPDSSGILVGSSYIYASGRDWARLGLLMLNEGQVNQQQLLSRQWIKAAIAPNSSENDKRYGFQFWLNYGDKIQRWPSLPTDAYAMLGNRQQSVMIIPSKNTVLVRIGWTKGTYPMEKNYHALLNLNVIPK